MEFIGYTVGLDANKGNNFCKIVKVEYNKKENGVVQLSVVSGLNLSKMNGAAAITQEQFDNRPQDAYNDIAEARWALKMCGWSLSADADSE